MMGFVSGLGRVSRGPFFVARFWVRESDGIAEPGRHRIAHEDAEVVTFHVDQLHVITGLEIDVVLTGQRLVDDHGQPIGLAKRRNGARITIAEQAEDLLFVGQFHGLVERVADLADVNAPVGTDDGEDKASLLVPEEDAERPPDYGCPGEFVSLVLFRHGRHLIRRRHDLGVHIVGPLRPNESRNLLDRIDV